MFCFFIVDYQKVKKDTGNENTNYKPAATKGHTPQPSQSQREYMQFLNYILYFTSTASFRNYKTLLPQRLKKLPGLFFCDSTSRQINVFSLDPYEQCLY